MSAASTTAGLVPPFDAWAVVGDEVEPLGSHWSQAAAVEAVGHFDGGAASTGLSIVEWHPKTTAAGRRMILDALAFQGYRDVTGFAAPPPATAPADPSQEYSGDATAPGAAPRAFVPSDEQAAIFDAVERREEHLVIVARAGTGKSTTLEHVTRRLPAGKRILVLAFNKEIERDLRARMPGHVTVKTTHGFGYSVAKAYRGNGVRPADDDKAWRRDMARAHLPLALHPYDAGAVFKLVERAKAWLADTDADLARLAADVGAEIDWTEYTDPDTEEALYSNADLYRWARAIMAASLAGEGAALTFDDMLYVPAKLGWRPRPAFDYVLVDEAQDLNRAQVTLARLALAKGGRMIVVGDPRQAIYQWRGADPDAMPRMIDDLRASKRGVVELPLTRTRRCPLAVVEVARRTVPDIRAVDGAPEGRVVADVSPDRMARDWAPGDFVISRLNAPLMRHCLAALKRGRRARIQGKDLGRELAAKVKKSKAKDIDAFVGWLRDDAASEVARLRKADASDAAIEAVEDRAEVLRALAEESSDTADMVERIETLFADRGDGQVIFTSAHRAKGLEADRVWLLRDTFLRQRRGKDGEVKPPSVEEHNLYYVAVTRSRRELYIVGGAA